MSRFHLESARWAKTQGGSRAPWVGYDVWFKDHSLGATVPRAASSPSLGKPEGDTVSVHGSIWDSRLDRSFLLGWFNIGLTQGEAPWKHVARNRLQLSIRESLFYHSPVGILLSTFVDFRKEYRGGA